MQDHRDTTATDLGDDPPVSAADALAIIEQEQARQEPDISGYFLLWGALWILIGLAWFGSGTQVWAADTAGITTGVLVVGGCLTSAWIGTRMNRGVSGPSSRFGAMYGIAWGVAIVGTGALVTALVGHAGQAAAPLIPALFVFVVGVLYTVTGAFYRDGLDFGLGLVVQLVAVVTAFTPAPWSSLVMGAGGGGALLAVGIIRRVRR